MAHCLGKTDWIALAVQPAWHGIGTVVGGVMTAEEAIRTARLTWGVGKESVYRFRPVSTEMLAPNIQTLLSQLRESIPQGLGIYLGNLRKMKAWAATVREDLAFDDPASDLGCVGSGYQPFQNAECFRVCDNIVGKLGARYEVAGSLMDGKRVWLLAQFPQTIQVKDDTVNPYILLSTSHDGSKALEIKFTAVRVVCWNTLSVALSDGKATVRIKHTAGACDGNGRILSGVVDVVKGELFKSVPVVENAAGEWLQFQSKLLNNLASYPVTDSFVRDYFGCIIPTPPTEKTTRSDNRRSLLLDIYNGQQPGHDQEAMKGTAYRLYQTVTFFNDHINGRQTTDPTTGQPKSAAELRFNRVMQTSGFREESLDILVEACETDGHSLTDALVKQRAAREETLLRAIAAG